MPLGKWAVEPVFLSRTPLPPDKKSRGHEFEAVCNGALVKCLRQLASIATIADRIFEEIGAECRLVVDRVDRLRVKVQVCQDAVLKLDAKTVCVPVSDLGATFKFLRSKKPYATFYDQPSQLFLPFTRPPCIDRLYNEASATPVALICTIDRYRTDGCTSSQLFMVTPVLGGTRKKKRKMLDIETRRPASFTLAQDRQENDEFGVSWSQTMLPKTVAPSVGRGTMSLDRLPSPEEQTMAMSLEYPSSVVQVDVSGSSFLRMGKFRRSLIHVDFMIKRKKSKQKSKRRHTVCEGDNKELEDAMHNISVTHTSCQTDDVPEVSSLFSFRRSLSRRRGRAATDRARRETVALDGLDLESLKKGSENNKLVVEDDKDQSLRKDNSTSSKKATKPSLKSRACNFNPISSLSAALSMAVKMRHSRTTGKHDDGRSSSGNWSASSSTRASVDSDQHHAVISGDTMSNPSRNSVGKDSVLSDTIRQESPIRSQDGLLCAQNQPLKSPSNQNATKHWAYDADRGRLSNASTPERTSDCASTPLVLSPYLGRKGLPHLHPSGSLDDGESSVYSVDTDGYYTSMHTDSGLWNNVINGLKLGDNLQSDSFRCRRRQESQSSVSTIGNSSINSFLSKTATENSSNNGSLKRQKLAPQPPPRISSSFNSYSNEFKDHDENTTNKDQKTEENDKSYSPILLRNNSASESDHDVGDRIRVKTTINSSRYPSMCAVSPETSDDELSDFREKTKSPTVNIIIAEVHREEKPTDIHGDIKANKSSEQQECNTQYMEKLCSKNSEANSHSLLINMYGSQSPIESSFTSSLPKSNKVTTSTPKQESASSSFSDSPETSKCSKINNATKELLPSLHIETQNFESTDNQFTVSSSPISPKNVPPNVEKTLIPLKYAQCITVTPIARNESTNSTDIFSRTSPHTRSRTFLKSPVAKCSSPPPKNSTSFLTKMTSNFTKNAPSYISFKAPDSPVSSSTSLASNQLMGRSTPVPHLDTERAAVTSPRAIARVTLDPAGKVIFTSSSLDRAKKQDLQNLNPPTYATLPRYQVPLVHTGTPKCSIENFNNTDTEKIMMTPGRSPQEMYKYPTRDNVITRNTVSPPNSHPHPQPNAFVSSVGQIANQYSSVPQYNTSMPRDFPGVQSNPTARDLFFRPSRGGRFCRTYFPSHLITKGAQSPDNQVPSPPSPSSSIQSESSNSSRSSFGTQPSPIRGTYLSSLTSPNSSNGFKQHQDSQPEKKPLLSSLPTYPVPSLLSNGRISNHISSNMNSQHSMTAPRVNTSQANNYRSLQHKVPDNYKFRPLYMPDRTLSANLSAGNYSFPRVVQEGNRHFSPVVDTYTEQEAIYDSKYSVFTPSNPPDVIPSSASPPSTLDITSPTTPYQAGQLNQNVQNIVTESRIFSADNIQSSKDQTTLKPLSANELFAIIHNSKKKHNIITESEKSLSPLSSRSSSPGFGQASTPNKAPGVETGVLTRNNAKFSKLGNKLNSDTIFQSPERKGAQDRLGRTKPTSMHDFKMLLLQTRAGGNDTNSRPSAAELLKVSPPKVSDSTRNTISRPMFSSSKQQYPQVRQSTTLAAGHSTVPLKRNIRTRSPYLTRYDSAYPPIWEDCSEELESSNEDRNHQCFTSNSQTNNSPQAQLYNTKAEPVANDNKTTLKATSTWV